MNRSFVDLRIGVWVLLATAGSLSACSVDDRQLYGVTQTSDVGAPNCGLVPDCDVSEVEDAGKAVNFGQLCAGLCPDLNHNEVTDSEETIVDNSNLNGDIAGWSADPGIGLGWNRTDACGRCDSGSVSVTNEFAGTSGDLAIGGARQCQTAEPGKSYEAMARVNPDPESVGRIALEFYESDDCTTAKTNTFNSPLITEDGKWQRASTPGTASDKAHSVSVRLVVGAPVQPKVGFATVFFDNVLVVATTP